jgi:MoaA/NifB/PqqE/SkfB family radical SAM enzyme
MPQPQPREQSDLWQLAATHGIFYASEILARLPEAAVLKLAEGPMRRGIPWQEGVDFLLRVLRLLKRNWTSFHPRVRRRLVENLFGHAFLRGADKRRQACRELGDYPTTMVISPTMRCNLRCTGCYSYNYEREDAISTERLDRLYTEAEELGIHFIVLTGGEPYLRDDTLELFAAHPHQIFMTYTNATILADQRLAWRLAELGNVIPCVSVEGFQEETDERRGKGTFKRIRRAMQDMREAGLLFGFSATPMRHNNELLLTDEFVRYYVELGCKVGWYFSYMPIGREPDLGLMPTPAQRLYRFHRIRALRDRHDILAADFWCDGMLTGGCLSGGRTYFHVNAQGGVEPCVFHQFSTDSILDKGLADCLASAYLRDVRKKLREVENPLRPCPVIDNPWMLRELVAQHQPKPSQAGGEATLEGELAHGLDAYADEVKRLFDPVFEARREGYPWPLEPVGSWEEKLEDRKGKQQA